MSNVVQLFDRDAQTGAALERLNAMNNRKLAEFQQATLESEALLAKLATLPNGHYARITLGKSDQVVIVYSSKTQLVNGSFVVSRYADSDAADTPTRYLTKQHMPQDLGDYSTFMDNHKAMWHLALKSANCPASGLAMVRAIDHLAQHNVPSQQEAVDLALEAFTQARHHNPDEGGYSVAQRDAKLATGA